jgi:hypothetical protein
MKNTIKVFGIITLVAVIGFGMTACDDGSKDDNDNSGGGQGITVTFSIDKVDARTFTVTQEGSIWTNTNFAPHLLFDYNGRWVTITGGNATNPWSDSSVVYAVDGSYAFDLTRTSDTLLTFTLKDTYYSVEGTIALNTEDLRVGSLHQLVNIDPSKTNTWINNPAKSSITF